MSRMLAALKRLQDDPSPVDGSAGSPSALPSDAGPGSQTPTLILNATEAAAAAATFTERATMTLEEFQALRAQVAATAVPPAQPLPDLLEAVHRQLESVEALVATPPELPEASVPAELAQVVPQLIVPQLVVPQLVGPQLVGPPTTSPPIVAPQAPDVGTLPPPEPAVDPQLQIVADRIERRAATRVLPPTEQLAERSLPVRGATPTSSTTVPLPIRKLRDTILAQLARDQSNAVLFLQPSEIPDRGFIIAELALATALELNRDVICVDADLDRSAGAGETPGMGLVDVLAGRTTWQRTVARTANPRVRLIASGRGNTPAALDEGRLSRVLNEMKKIHKLVLIDGGDARASLASALARRCDATYLFLQLGVTPQRDLQRAVDAIQSTQGRLCGCILTGTSAADAA